MDEQRRKDLERLSILLDAPHMNVAAIDRTYLRLIAQRLSIIAQAGYQREGRGAIVLGVARNTIHRANAEGLPCYQPQSKAHIAGAGIPIPALWQAVETYNPRREFVVCMVRTPDSSIYTLPLPLPDTAITDGTREP